MRRMIELKLFVDIITFLSYYFTELVKINLLFNSQVEEGKE